MIVKMKKSTVICLLAEKTKALESLRELGVLHVEITEMNDSEDRAVLEMHLMEAKHASHILASIKTKEEPEKETNSIKGPDLCQLILDFDKNKTELSKELDSLERDKGLLEPWGEFSPELISSLKDKGIFVYLCSGTHEEFAEIPEDVTTKFIKSEKHRVYFVVICDGPIAEETLPIAKIPTQYSLNEVKEKIAECERNLVNIQNDLIKLLSHKHQIDDYIRNIEEQIEFASNRDGMIESGAVSCINGYCPVPEVENLQDAARENGWGLWLTDPTDADSPPTLIKIPKIFECSKALFDFIGISPGYQEWDTSACFLIFFTLFFSMIMGDAGYGTLFLIAAIFAKKKFGNKPNLKFYLNLFLLLSIATILWGFVTGNYFAIPSKYIPEWMQGLDWFTDPALKDKHIMELCFLIAATHLSFARIWKASLVLNSTKAFGEIGWGLILWGNFFIARKLIVYPDSEWPMTIISILYGIGLFFIIVFGVNWKKMDESFGFLFGMSGTFVDLLSYIRLFAVGLSSYYIAKSFNDMGVMVFHSTSNIYALPFLIIGMVVIIFLGHFLNLLLGFLGVLVHGIRLNTLEFSNHMGLQWLGHIYKPFKKDKEE